MEPKLLPPYAEAAYANDGEAVSDQAQFLFCAECPIENFYCLQATLLPFYDVYQGTPHTREGGLSQWKDGSLGTVHTCVVTANTQIPRTLTIVLINNFVSFPT